MRVPYFKQVYQQYTNSLHSDGRLKGTHALPFLPIGSIGTPSGLQLQMQSNFCSEHGNGDRKLKCKCGHMRCASERIPLVFF